MDLNDRKLQLKWWADKQKIPAQFKGLRDACQVGVETIEWAQRRIQELLEANNRYLERARAAEATFRHPKVLFRHKKRGGTYEAVGTGKMQTENWCVFGGDSAPSPSVDMASVCIYRSTEDGSLWVRPEEEFNDGRFEVVSVTDAPPPSQHVVRSCIRCGGVEEMPENGVTCSICIEAIRTGSEPNGADRRPSPQPRAEGDPQP